MYTLTFTIETDDGKEQIEEAIRAASLTEAIAEANALMEDVAADHDVRDLFDAQLTQFGQVVAQPGGNDGALHPV